jgi:hypothetical protein
VDMFFIRKREGIVSGEMNIPGKIYVVKAGTPDG